MAQETTIGMEPTTSLYEKLDKIRSPKLQGQNKNRIVLESIDETLKLQKLDLSPISYFSALLSLLEKAVPQDGRNVDKDLASSVVYLLDLVTPYAPQSLLRTKFSQIFTNLVPALSLPDADAPLLRASIGCLESLLIAQDSTAWKMSTTQVGPRQAMVGLLSLALDHRPKIRKRAQEALSKIIKNPPPSPSIDHPAADMCADTALRGLVQLDEKANQAKKQKKEAIQDESAPGLIHALQLVRTIAAATGGWPSKKIEDLCEVLLSISKSRNEYMTTTAFEVFEIIFQGMADDSSSAKLHRILEAISELQPSQNDTQLLPPWVAVLSSGYEVSAQLEPEETFQKLPELFALVSSFLASSSHAIRISASTCLITFMVNCVPSSVILEPSIYDEKTFEKLGKAAVDLLNVKYQAAWMEVFTVLGAMFDGLSWKSDPYLINVVKTVGELRGNDSFTGKKEADEVLKKAIRAMGPEAVLNILPLNIAKPKAGEPGRAWLLPVMYNNISNTNLGHFKTEFLPLINEISAKVDGHGASAKTDLIKAYEIIIEQAWSLLPGYCNLPLDLTQSFDEAFAELLAKTLYEHITLRPQICRALQNLVDSNTALLDNEEEKEDMLLQSRTSSAVVETNIGYLATFSGRILLALFNVYGETLPQNRGHILLCINSYLRISPAHELMTLFEQVTSSLASSLEEAGAQTQAEKQKQKKSENKMPPLSHTLMDLVVAISIYLPRESFSTLFEISSRIIVKNDDPQLQKKAYKLIPRLSDSPTGKLALQERNLELQQLLLGSAENVSTPAKRDRLTAISTLIPFLPEDSLHFIPSIISEVVLACKEVNEKARTTAFDLLVLMGERIVSSPNALIHQSKIPNMPADSPSVPATIEEYLAMVGYGLGGVSPQAKSASILALTRLIYHFSKSLSDKELEESMDTVIEVCLKLKNREIVQSALGFVKVCVISISNEIMLPRLKTLIPNLIVWSNEHKAHFKAKVKHILERMIRRFGVDIVNQYCPEEDRKLIANIRKTKERNKRRKDAAKAGEDDGSDGEEEGNKSSKKKNRFENEYDEVMYGSDASDNDSNGSDDEALPKRGKAGKRGNIYITEDNDEPIDLLNPKSLANISSTKPQQRKASSKTKVKTNEDGKLILGGPDSDGDGDAMDVDAPSHEDGDTGVGAYVHAISGKDAVKRGQKGRLKFSNKKGQDDMDDEMDVDDEDAGKSKNSEKRGGPSDRRGRGGKGGIAAGRRGLGEQKRTGSNSGGGSHRVMKSSRGGGRGSHGRGRGGGGFRK